MFMFFFLAKESKLLFYPGSGTDLVPTLIDQSTSGVAFSNQREFIYCDPAEQVHAFFKRFLSLEGKKLSSRELQNLNPQYEVLISRLAPKYMHIKEAKYLNESIGSIQINIATKPHKGDEFESTLNFFPTTAERYLDHIHSTFYEENQIDTLLHVTQISSPKGSEDYLFNPKNFLQLLATHPNLANIEFVITDNPELFSGTFLESSFGQIGQVIAGWGRSGNTMVEKNSAHILMKNQPGANFVSEDDQPESDQNGNNIYNEPNNKLDQIREKLKTLKFK